MTAAEPFPDALDATFTALADPVRRRAVEVLVAGPRRSGQLAGEVGVSPATMSKHLRVLRASGLVTRHDDAVDTRVRIYALADAPLRGLARWLAAAEQAWVDQLGAFVDHVGATARSDGASGTGPVR